MMDRPAWWDDPQYQDRDLWFLKGHDGVVTKHSFSHKVELTDDGMRVKVALVGRGIVGSKYGT